ncbi:Rieske 2Fe-2S domain-containing protein [Saprospiraceae bacterium]|nr:Rieske 2Fe-2S domain-containing protein [Saprospiraceae bacterium]MDB4768967.1 Rieske 2Fe-2S domain-containing protein [Saprospiraceae bacterium]MDC3219731.1 Rieske 2Fe-2S domain-containing protein [Saprospiraceae bacterium]
MKKVIFSNEEFEENLEHLNRLMGEAEGLPYPNAKELVFDILKYFDSIHREPLSRMMEMLDKNHPSLRNELEDDFSLKTMLGLYDLIQKKAPEPEVEKEKVLGFVPLEEVVLLNPEKKKEWLELGNVKDLEEKKLYPKNFERVNFLISKVDTKVYAVQNQCIDSILPIDSGKLEEHFLICPWHGCRYDLKTGKAENQPQKQLEIFPVEIEEGGLLKVEISY